ncbi:hypothetical protein ETD85_56425 [Nonomuraea zeae]|uniref:Uncharacterized protein n=1 Tax=Nonomuraea zeae TaxID=1642303 RepID=A0A5S4FB66_9ACTN|nr:hypothetical protein ETD85_56425 [Nonomuraea zeae]
MNSSMSATHWRRERPIGLSVSCFEPTRAGDAPSLSSTTAVPASSSSAGAATTAVGDRPTSVPYSR